ncbi:hypothetical protein GOP47_0013202 [Adiantum capillus-veneris]|uniref:RING-type E3 ubiquitin transferase n=1 Tax=Adiantum capillus-veneris TaxID=13818 RepID=A0A9D4UNS3_ADICA|nr:hypothetical protein GOP47_0013202 [Adiantum capillus-veneris]
MLSWGGLTFCLSGAALYCLSRNTGRDAADLKSVKRVNQLKDLAALLESACKALPLVVTVAGRVGSDAPISCEHSSLRGVILEEIAEQHFLKHNESGSWIQDSALMLAMSKEVPWYLEDGTGRIFVIGARGAHGLELPIASEVFEESGRSLVRGTLDYLQGLKMLGVKRVERVLPVGTTLTVVGEAVQDDLGTLRIQKPHKGPFYVSPKSIDELIINLGKWSRWYKFMSLGFTVFGLYLMTTHAIKYFFERRRRAALNRRVMEAAAQRRERQQQGEIDGRDGHLEDDIFEPKMDSVVPDLCVICLEQEYNAVFVPCGHMCSCTSCSTQLSNCPLCRRRIEQVVRTYRH